MRRAFIALIGVLTLTVGVATAHADVGSGGTGIGFPFTSIVPVAGTVQSVNPDGSFVAEAFTLTPPSLMSADGAHRSGDFGLGNLLGGFLGGGGSGGLGNLLGGFLNFPTPTPTQVTITPGPNTLTIVNGQPQSASSISAGDKFLALFNGAPSDSIQTLTASPPLAIFDHSPPKPKQLYAFVGSVTAVDTTAGTVTVNVAESLPSGLVPSGSPPVQFTVGADTLVLGGSSSSGLGSSLSGVSVGDIVAGGLVGPQGETLAQVEQSPLKLLLDIPLQSGSTTSAAAKSRAERRALERALALLEGKSEHRRHRSHHKHHKHHKSHSRHR